MDNRVLFDVEKFRDDFILYIAIPGHKPILIQNPSKEYVRIFMRRANIHPTCLWYGMFWDLYKYLYSITWLDLLINKKEVSNHERTNERGIEHEE
jgi:hypothetical protein